VYRCSGFPSDFFARKRFAIGTRLWFACVQFRRKSSNFVRLLYIFYCAVRIVGVAMVKYNPATKAAERAEDLNGGKEEESSESDIVSQMLENYEEYETHRSRPQTDVVERLPDHAEMKDGKLWVPDPETAYDFNRNRMSLTELRRRVLLMALENPDATNVEVADIVGCSNSLVSRTKTVFGFLLDDPYLLDAFVYKGQVPSDYFVVRNGDEEFAFPLKEQAVEAGEELWGGDCQIVAPEDDDAVFETEDDSEDESSLSPEELEDSLGPDSETSTDSSGDDSDDFEDQTERDEPEPSDTGSADHVEKDGLDESEERIVSLSVTLEEFSSLLRGADDELHLRLLQQLYDQ